MKRLPLALTLLVVCLAAPCWAETIFGQLSYTHPFGSPVAGGGAARRPVISRRVEIWRWLPEPVWTRVAVTSTDDDGNFSVTVPNWPGLPTSRLQSRYTVAVAAEADGIEVREMNSVPPLVSPNVFKDFIGGGSPLTGQGTPTVHYASSPNARLEFTFDWHSGFAARHFHVVEVLRFGRGYAGAHRDQRETDGIGTVIVQPVDQSDPGITFYDPTVNTLRWGRDFFFSDHTVLHEYGHFIEEQLGTFLPLPTSHDGCTTTLGPMLVNSSEHAWMEGFASWFSLAVRRANPGRLAADNPPGGTASPATAESYAGNCGTIGRASSPLAGTDSGGTVMPWQIEDGVTAVLWDLTDSFSATESWEPTADQDRAIFEIFDRELDLAPANGFPTLLKFHQAWVARGLDPWRLERLLQHIRVPFTALVENFTQAAMEGSRPLVRNGSGGLTGFHRGTDFGLYGARQGSAGSAFSGWTREPGSVWSSIAASWVAPSSRPVQALFRGIDYQLHLVRTNGTPASSQEVTLPSLDGTSLSPLAGEPLVFPTSTGRLRVFARDLAGRMFTIQQSSLDGPFPSSWSSLPGIATASLGGAESSVLRRTLLVHRGTDGLFYRCSFNGTCGWTPIAGATFTSAPVVVARGGGDDTFVVCGRSGQFARCAEERTDGSFGPWTTVSTVAVGSVVDGMADGRRVTVVFRADDFTHQVIRAEQVAPFADWVSTPMGGTASSAPHIAVDAAGRRTIAMRDAQLGVSVRAETSPGVWASGWTSLGGVAMDF